MFQSNVVIGLVYLTSFYAKRKKAFQNLDHSFQRNDLIEEKRKEEEKRAKRVFFLLVRLLPTKPIEAQEELLE